jgi:predicted adenine nucleotide alpha hydrolase (AANH) superfamily ATPase
MLRLKENEIDYTLYFFNPNIHPEPEYILRKNENKRYAEKLGVPFVDEDESYEQDRDAWFQRLGIYGNEPERGRRCTGCFEMRFEATARYALDHGYDVISSSLGISRWKDMAQINRAGEKAAECFQQLAYWTFNWRKEGGSSNMITISKEEHFYQQEYCGCVYSLRDTNQWRTKNNRSKIKLGEKYYGLEVEEPSQQ